MKGLLLCHGCLPNPRAERSPDITVLVVVQQHFGMTVTFASYSIPSAKNWSTALGVKSEVHANPGFLDFWLLQIPV